MPCAGGSKNIARYTNLNREIFIVVTYSDANDQLRLYFNGDLVTTLTGLGTASANVLNSTYANIGSYTSGGTNPSNGWAGRVAIFNAALTQAQVVALYNSIRLKYAENLFVIGDSKSAWNSISGIWVDTFIEAITTASGDLWGERPYKYAVGGYDVGEMDTYMQANLANTVGNPGTVLINMGANDAVQPTPQVDFEAQLTSIIDQCRTKWGTGIQIYVAKPWRSDESANCDILAGYIDNVIATYASNVYDGPDERIWLENGDNGATYTSDGIHYNAAGAIEAADQWLTVLGY